MVRVLLLPWSLIWWVIPEPELTQGSDTELHFRSLIGEVVQLSLLMRYRNGKAGAQWCWEDLEVWFYRSPCLGRLMMVLCLSQTSRRDSSSCFLRAVSQPWKLWSKHFLIGVNTLWSELHQILSMWGVGVYEIHWSVSSSQWKGFHLTTGAPFMSLF